MNDCEKRILASREWPFLEKQFTVITGATVTVTIASPAVFTLTGHGFQINDALFFSTTGTLPTGITAGTVYYVISAGLTSSQFQVSTSIGGSAVNTSGTQSGTHSVIPRRYYLPMYVRKVQSIFVTVGNRRFAPLECTSRTQWDKLNEIVVTSDIPVWWYQYADRLELFPKPATATNIITINAVKMAKDLTIADYTTGTITTATNGDTGITGGGGTPPSWTASMIGRYLQIAETNAAGGGDNFWYEITAVPTATTLVLGRPYAGTSISAGSAAYTIGQVSLLPEPFDQIPIYEAMKVYFSSVETDDNQAQLFGGLASELYKQLVESYGSKSSGVVVESGHDYELINPNLTLTL